MTRTMTRTMTKTMTKTRTKTRTKNNNKKDKMKNNSFMRMFRMLTATIALCCFTNAWAEAVVVHVEKAQPLHYAVLPMHGLRL